MKKTLYGMSALLGIGFLASAVRLFAPVRSRDESIVFFPLIPEDEVPRLGVKKAELVFTAAGKERKTRVFLVATAEGMAAFSATCSHLGCLVSFNKEKQEFLCPCHGGRYDLAGRNIAGPPPAPLARFPMKVQNSMLCLGVKV